MIITSKEWDRILELKSKGILLTKISVDFGQREVEVRFKEKYILIGKEKVSLRTRLKKNFCYILKENKALPLAFFSKTTGFFYRLIPTQDWPSLSIGSSPMHRIKLSSPKEDVFSKIKFLKPKGYVLDTCAGLGYSAILVSENSREVYTFERDKNVIFLARLNPLSRPLFTSKNIKFIEADIAKEIRGFPDNYFHCIIHDPPTFKISPTLYSLDFYFQLQRVLKPAGRMYHYCPLPQRSKGKDFSLAIKKRLREAGFKKVVFREESQGFYMSK